MNLLVTICARGGSKGIPQKNIKPLNGRPLIGYSISIANELKSRLKNVVVELSTDDSDILIVSKGLGLNTNYIRPDFLATDNAGKVDAIKDLYFYAEKIYNTKFDLVLDLDVSSPLRNIEDILGAIELFNKDREALTLFSVNKAHKNPYFNMVERNAFGYYDLSKKLNHTTLSRQSAPEVFELNASFYLYKTDFFKSDIKGVITDKSLIYEINHVCFDLDHSIDFDFLEFLIVNKKLDFDLL